MQGSINPSDPEAGYEPLLERPPASSTAKIEPLSWAEKGLFIGLAIAPVYLGLRSANSDLSVPLIGFIQPASQTTRGLVGAATGLYIGPTWGFRTLEWVDSITAAKSEKDQRNRQKYPFRFGLLKYLPPIFAATAVILVNAAEVTDGVGLFRPEDFLGFSIAEKMIVPSIYGAYLGATLSVRLGNAIDILSNDTPYKQVSYAECGLYLGLIFMSFYLEIRGCLDSTLNIPMVGEINTGHTAAQGATGFGLGTLAGLFWFYRLLETIDAWTLPLEKRAGSECRYGMLRIIPLVSALTATCLSTLAKVTDAAGLFKPSEFIQFPRVEQGIISFIEGAYIGATASVRFGNMLDRTREYFTGPLQAHHAREQSPHALEFLATPAHFARADTQPEPTE